MFAKLDLTSEAVKGTLSDPAFTWTFNEGTLTLSRPNGSSVSYDRTRTEWGALETYKESASYDTVYAFHDGSFIGKKGGSLSLRVGTGKQLIYDVSQSIPASSHVLGVAPGFLSATVEDGVIVVRANAALSNSIKIKGAPDGIRDITPCISGCIVWGFDGSRLHTYGDDGLWIAHKLPFDLPEGKSLSRVAMKLSLNAKAELVVDDAAFLTIDGDFFLSRLQGVDNRAVTFEQVKRLTSLYCINCHSADAFDQEAGLKAFKTKAITRLSADAANPLVMPPKSAPKAMSAADKATVISWLKLQTDGVDKEPTDKGTNPPPPQEDKSKMAVTGVIQTQGGKYCVGCHPTAKFQAFWYDNQAEVIARVTNGTMPRGRVMVNEDKAALLKAVNELP
jgi:hypothetical protein